MTIFSDSNLDRNAFFVDNYNLYNYNLIKQLKTTNTNLNIKDKNFTFIISFSNISPYSFYNNNNKNFEYNIYNSRPYAPLDFFDNYDYYYNNADRLDQYNKQKFTYIFPIFSLSQQCYYKKINDNNITYYNCFFVYIEDGSIHQVINDNTSHVEKIHLSIDIKDIEQEKFFQYHLILTRDDDYFIMHLIKDENALYSGTDITHIYNINYKALDKYNAAKYLKYHTKISPNVFYNHASINIDEDKIYYGLYNSYYGLNFNINIQNSNNTYKFLILFTPSYYPNARTVTMYTTHNLSNFYKIHFTYCQGSNDIKYTSTISPVVRQTDRITHETITEDAIYEKGQYTVSYNTSWTQTDINETLLEVLYNTHKGTPLSDPQPQAVLLMSDTAKYDQPFIDQDFNNISVYQKIKGDININDILLDSTLSIGYTERYPIDININTLLYKNSFKGYISEFYIIENQTYYKKFENLINKRYFNYKTNLNKTFSIQESGYRDITPNDKYVLDGAKNSYQQPKIYNPTNIPFSQKYDSILSISQSERKSMGVGSDMYNIIHYTTDDVLKAINNKIQYINKINNIQLIDKDLINSSNNTTIATNSITHREYDLDYSFNDNYIPNNINDSTNITFCIFNFELFKSYNLYTQYTSAPLQDSTIEILAHKQFLMDINYNLIEYDQTKSYADYTNLHLNNMALLTVDIFNNKKHFIINALNNYINTLNNDIIINKFYITTIRDNRKQFIYDLIQNKTKQSSLDNIQTFAHTSSNTHLHATQLPNSTDKFYYDEKLSFKHNNNTISGYKINGSSLDYVSYIINGVAYSDSSNIYNEQLGKFTDTYKFYSLDYYFPNSYDINKIESISPNRQTFTLYNTDVRIVDTGDINLIDRYNNLYQQLKDTHIYSLYDITQLNDVLNSDSTGQFNDFIQDFNFPSYLSQDSTNLVDSTIYINDIQKINVLHEVDLFVNAKYIKVAPYTITNENNIYEVTYDKSYITDDKYQLFIKFKSTKLPNKQLSIIKEFNNIYNNNNIYRIYPTQSHNPANLIYKYYKNNYSTFYNLSKKDYKTNIYLNERKNTPVGPVTYQLNILYNNCTKKIANNDLAKDYISNAQHMYQNTYKIQLTNICTPIDISYESNKVTINFKTNLV